ncbi:hypothetical protein RAC89_22080 [Paenibacillus sp. GD4]|jgi:hypothetical protein|uniref:hypothetical protein n=1 Tax=Paenibacillus sp. GD4 TaxID=3068890 RepID=UPI0027968CF8|nr:hypothetical protein [Paenibacillus sp. GD4]MDQ1913086.1 hypothetical protein [Paenibacillus sp. GD4]
MSMKPGLSDNPDVVFNEMIRIIIKAEDFDFWLRFSSEWGGVLYVFDERNTKQLEAGHITEEAHENTRRSLRLGMITLSGLYDALKAWSDQHQEDYIYSMNTLDCFYIPVYLNDFEQIRKSDSDKCGIYTQVILHQLSKQGELKERLASIEETVKEYTANIHLYSRR